MTKKEVSAILEELAMLLELAGGSPCRARADVTVARELEKSEAAPDVLVREKRLREIKGVGDALEQKIEELVTTGRLEYYQELRAQYPESLFELFRIPGLGAQKIKVLHEDLKINSLDELEHACNGAIAALKGFGGKTEKKIL